MIFRHRLSICQTIALPPFVISLRRRQQRFIKAVWQESRGRAFDGIFWRVLVTWQNGETVMTLMDAAERSHRLKGIKEEEVAMAIVPGTFYYRAGICYWKPFQAETDRLIRGPFESAGEEEGNNT